jgi:hypothetical protein
MLYDCDPSRVPPPADLVNQPPHYKTSSGLEAIQVIEAFKLPYHLGNVVKYVLRHASKGAPLEDLKKARWYLERQISRMEAEDA